MISLKDWILVQWKMCRLSPVKMYPTLRARIICWRAFSRVLLLCLTVHLLILQITTPVMLWLSILT
uniref:GSVIVT01029553001 n=1 Tax=Arundo donax TaxID=35708 RepID=A0A0A9EYJ9_ARUDO